MSFSLEYGTGSIAGELGLETIVFDGFEVKTVEIGVVTMEFGEVFEKIPFAGIIGISPNEVPTSFLQQVYSQLNFTVLSIHLSENTSDLGFISFSNFSSVEMTKSSSDLYWQIDLSKFFIGTNDLCELSSCKAVIDTGTSVISLPGNVFNVIRRKIHVLTDCSNADKLPNMLININNQEYQIPSYEYIAYNQGTCSLALMKLDIPEPIGPFYILGLTFLRKVTLSLDFVKNNIGIAENSRIFIKNKLVKL